MAFGLQLKAQPQLCFESASKTNAKDWLRSSPKANPFAVQSLVLSDYTAPGRLVFTAHSYLIKSICFRLFFGARSYSIL